MKTHFKHILTSSLFISCLTPAYANTLNLDPPKKLVKKNYSLGGQLTLKDSVETGKPTISASATYKPDSKNYWFFKGTIRHKFENDDEDFSFSWGLGYDDWHTGTWTVQLNNYESIKIGEGFKIDKAIASVGYKLDSKFLKDNRLSSAVTLSKPIEGDASLSASLKWSPKSYWFIKGILIAPLEGDGDLKYNYLFGYDDWHPKAFGIEYSNYAGNPLGETNFKEGNLSLTYKWKFK